MPTVQDGVFVLEKNDTFEIDKGFKTVHVGVFWEPAERGQPQLDVDTHAILLVYKGGDSNTPKMYGQGSHFLTYANKTLSSVSDDDGTKIGFQTADSSMFHSEDNRRGGDSGLEHDAHEDPEEEISEEMTFNLDKLPQTGLEVAIWLTIHDASKRKLDFSKINGLFVEVCDPSDSQLCRYHPAGEFAGFTALQVASLVRDDRGSWSFHAIGAGSKKGLQDIIDAYS